MGVSRAFASAARFAGVGAVMLNTLVPPPLPSPLRCSPKRERRGRSRAPASTVMELNNMAPDMTT